MHGSYEVLKEHQKVKVGVQKRHKGGERERSNSLFIVKHMSYKLIVLSLSHHKNSHTQVNIVMKSSPNVCIHAFVLFPTSGSIIYPCTFCSINFTISINYRQTNLNHWTCMITDQNWAYLIKSVLPFF